MKDNNALRTVGWVMLGVGYVAGAISFVEVRSSHPTVIWTILQNAATVISGLAVVCLGNFYWRRRRRGGRSPGRVAPSESQISRFLASRRNRHGG